MTSSSASSAFRRCSSRRMRRPRIRRGRWRRFVAPAASARCSGAIPTTTQLCGRARPSISRRTSGVSGSGEPTAHRNRRSPPSPRSSAPNDAPPGQADAWIDIDRSEFRLDPSAQLPRLYRRYREQGQPVIGLCDRLRLARRGEDRIDQVAQTSSGEADGAVGGAVVEADLVAGLVVDEAAGKDGVGNVAGSLVVR